MHVAAGGGAAVFGVVMALLFFAFGVACFAFWIWSIVDAVKFTDAQYQAIGHSKVVWIVVIVVVGTLGSLLYLCIPRPKLKEASRY